MLVEYGQDNDFKVLSEDEHASLQITISSLCLVERTKAISYSMKEHFHRYRFRHHP